MSTSFAAPVVRWHVSQLGVAAALIATPLAMHISAGDEVDSSAALAMQTFLARPTITHHYRASRRLEASGSGQRAWLDVRTDFTIASGLQYEVTAEGGSRYIRARVLRSLLDEEQQLIARRDEARVAISTANYDFTPEGFNDEGLAVVGLQPRRQDRSLIAGRMFLTADGDLVRLEGRLARNPSWWTTRVNVVRSYRLINGAVMPVSLETTAHLRVLGSSALRMTYRYSHIDERPVDENDVDY